MVVGCMIAAGVLLAAFVVIESRIRAPMFDLSLLRTPTFVGGLVAAFGISASLFSLFTYIVLYFQNVLHYSALDTGVRFLVLSGAIFFVAGAAGRLTAHMPARFLIGPGFLLIGGGLLLMRGITPGSAWTHLIPGMIVAGAGAGLVNVPLASTAVGVVRPERAGMASGINSTFRQVGIATGIAALGSLFSSQVRDTVTHSLAGTPLRDVSGRIADALTSGDGGSSLSQVPAALRGTVAEAGRAGFVDGLNHILLVGAVVAFVAAVLSLVLIRPKDLVDSAEHAPAPVSDSPEPGAEAVLTV
jgi:hypothetical protein